MRGRACGRGRSRRGFVENAAPGRGAPPGEGGAPTQIEPDRATEIGVTTKPIGAVVAAAFSAAPGLAMDAATLQVA